MNFVSRGIRNAFRNIIRTFSIVLILGLSIGLAMTMLIARQAVQTKIDSVKSSIGNTITISPAGARGLQGGGEPLTNEQAGQVKSTSHVVSVTEVLQDRLESTNSNLQSAIEAGSIGRRFNNGNSSSGTTQAPTPNPSSSNANRPPQNFAPPVFVVGTNTLVGSVLNGGGTISVTNGQAFDAGTDENVALVGKDLANKNNLVVGSTFTAYNTQMVVTGIFDSGNTFSNNTVVMPLSTLQRVSAQPGAVTSMIVQVDSISNISSTVAEIQSKLGTAADVVSQQDTSDQALAPLESIKGITLISLVGSVIAGAVIIFLAMLMIVRERRKEIGVLKAIGSTNRRIVAQFMVEAITLTILAMVVGVAIGVIGSAPVTKILVANSSSTTTQNSNAPGPGGGAPTFGGGRSQNGGRIQMAGRGINDSINNIKVSVGWQVLLYGFVAALIIALLGSAIPAWLIAKVRPAEVMRSE